MNRCQNSEGASRPKRIGLGSLWYVGVYSAAFLGLLLILSAFGVDGAFFSDDSETLALPIQVDYASGKIDDLPDTKELEVVTAGHEKVRVTFTQSWARFTYGFVIGLSFTLGLFFIAVQLRAFFREVRNGRPFAPENPGRVRRIGLTIACCGPIYGLGTWLLARFFVSQIDLPGATLDTYFDWHVELVFVGLIVIVIAQILEMGTRMQHEQDLTV